MLLIKYIIVISSLLMVCKCEVSSLENIYKKGVEAYTREDWSECIIQFEESLSLYKLYKSIVINCRHKCKSFPYKYHINEDLEDLRIYEKIFLISNCLMGCQKEEFEKLSIKNNIPDSIISKMMDLKPYEYLHVCYYQTHHIQKAASAASTYLFAHPDDTVMYNNLKQYIKMLNMNDSEISNLEAEKYMMLYNLALKSYNKKDWSQTVEYMEAAIRSYLSSEENCRAECEQLPEQEWTPDFIVTLSKSIASLLSCRQHCQSKLKSIEYNSGVEFLAEILNYLQISYYNLDKLDDAAQATASYLALKPDDEYMLENKEIYNTLTTEKSFVERTDIVYYLKRDHYEKELIKFYLQENELFNSVTII